MEPLTGHRTRGLWLWRNEPARAVDSAAVEYRLMMVMIMVVGQHDQRFRALFGPVNRFSRFVSCDFVRKILSRSSELDETFVWKQAMGKILSVLSVVGLSFRLSGHVIGRL